MQAVGWRSSKGATEVYRRICICEFIYVILHCRKYIIGNGSFCAKAPVCEESGIGGGCAGLILYFKEKKFRLFLFFVLNYA